MVSIVGLAFFDGPNRTFSAANDLTGTLSARRYKRRPIPSFLIRHRSLARHARSLVRRRVTLTPNRFSTFYFFPIHSSRERSLPREVDQKPQHNQPPYHVTAPENPDRPFRVFH